MANINKVPGGSSSTSSHAKMKKAKNSFKQSLKRKLERFTTRASVLFADQNKYFMMAAERQKKQDNVNNKNLIGQQLALGVQQALVEKSKSKSRESSVED